MPALFVVFFALVLDRLLGEPKKYHPLAGFGNLAQKIENWLNQDSKANLNHRLSGLIALVILVAPFVLIAAYLSSVHWLFDLALLTLAIGWQSLREHSLAIYHTLLENNLELARKKVGMIVSRDTSELNEEQICKASIESVLENGADAIFSALFWFIIAGAPGVVAYRLVNTLDAMWGYRTPRFLHFGWAAARLDDVMNFIPSRLTALSYFIASRNLNAIKCWQIQAKTWKSPNAGPVMAAGAGGLNLELGGEAVYHGETQQRPVLGNGRKAKSSDIPTALSLITHSIIVWLITLAVITGVIHYASV
ncbi:MAG: adenosylcobinamide-phosphate synthase CbiB [Gammaproteobacteria bacterium]|nr:adenosylcobinamide-phosphate synthase CbiB [Gammaproteobacteria bacterium]